MHLTITVNINRAHGSTPCGAEGDPLMEALANLTAGIDRLTAAVDRLANAGGVGGGVPEADVQAQADRVVEQAQRLEAIPTPTGTGDSSGASTLRK